MCPIVNLQLVVKCKKRSFHSFKVEVALLRYIVFYCKLRCDTSEPQVSYISRACSSLVRQPYYIPNRFFENQRLGDHTCDRERSFGWQNILYRRIYVDFSFLTVHKVCTKARLLGERSVRIREVKGSNPSRSTFSSSVILTLLLFFCMCIGHTLALEPRGIQTARPCRRQGKQPAQCNGDDRSQWLKQGGAVGAAF